MFLKLAYLPSKLRVSGKYLFQEHQISAGELSADSSSTETLYCFIKKLGELRGNCASRANICFKNIKFPRGNYQPIVPRQKHSIV